MNYLVLLVYFIASSIFIDFLTASSLQELTQSFSQCIITLNYFDKHDHILNLDVPIILNFAKSAFQLTSRVHRRKHCFCVLNEIFYPEKMTDNKASLLDVEFRLINLILYATAPVYSDKIVWKAIYEQYLKSGITQNNLYNTVPLNLLEYHYLFIITEEDPSDLESQIISDKLGLVAQAFIIKSFKYLRSQLVESVTYICFYCLPEHSVAVDITNFGRMKSMNQTVTHHFLDLAIDFVTQNGSKLFVQFSYFRKFIDYPEYMVDSKLGRIQPLSPFNINLDRKGRRLRIVEISEILLFDCMNLTNTLPESLEHLQNYEYTTYTLSPNYMHYNYRPVILQNDPKFMRLAYSQTFTATTSYTFNFITCDGVHHRSIDNMNNFLTFYFTPFDYRVWFILLCSLIILPLIITSMAKSVDSLISRDETSFFQDICFNIELTVSSLLENGRDFNLQKYLTNKIQLLQGPIYIALAGWTLSLVLLNNVYKGILTSNELVELPLESKWKTICDLATHNVNIITFIRPEEEHKYIGNEHKLSQASRRHSYFGCLYEFYYRQKLGTSKCVMNSNSTSSFLRKSLRNVYERLSTCDKIALVDTTDIIDQMLDWFHLESPKIKFIKGNEKFLRGTMGFFIIGYSSPLMGRIHRRLRLLIESGILQLFQDWFKPEGSESFKIATSALELKSQHSKQFTLKYKIVEVYPDMIPTLALSLIGIALAISTFLGEIVHFNFDWNKREIIKL